MLNVILHQVGMSLIICPNTEILYEIDESNYPDWLNKVPLYNTDICLKFHGKLFETFITHARLDRYNLMCSIVEHDIKNPLKMNKSVLEICQ